MIESPIADRFSSDFNRMFGSMPLAFKLDGDKEPRPDIPKWQINRTNARSAGRKTFQHTAPCRSCGGFIRLTHRVYAGTKINKCAGCN